ncbi:MAG: hypothetical protein ACJ74O_08465 [Frankiaceae bacterium]
MSYLRKRAGIVLLAASLMAGAAVPLAAGPAAAVTDPLAGSAGPALLYPSMPTDATSPTQQNVPPGMTVDEFLRHPVLSWQPIGNLPVTRYRVQLSPNADWTNNQVALPDSGVTQMTQYELPTTLPHASYFWRVRGEDAAGHHTNWSGAMDDSSDWQFARTWIDRPAVLQSNRADGSIELRWAPLNDASSYELQISNDPYFPPSPPDPLFTFDCFVNHTTWSIEQSTGDAPMEAGCGDYQKLLAGLAAGGTIFWRVRGIDGTTAAALPAETSAPCRDSGADCSGWSDPVSTLSVPDTSAPTSGLTGGLDVNCSPLPGGTVPMCPETPTMSWDAVPGADGYIVDVSVDPMFTVVYRSYGVWDAHSLTPRDSYLDNQSGGSYFWRVIPCDYDLDLHAFGNCQTTREDAPVATFHKRSLPLPATPASTASSTTGHDGLYVTVGNAETFAARTVQVRTAQVTFHWDGFLEYQQQQHGVSPLQEAKQYLLQYADNPYFDDSSSVVVDGTRWTPASTLPDGTYYWHVQPVDGSNDHLTWSGTTAFVKGTVPPVAQLAGTGYLNPFQKVEIDFSRPVSGVTPSTIGLEDALSGTAIAGNVSFPNPGTAFFTPSSTLLPGQQLKVWVTGAVRDLAGNPAQAGPEVRTVNPVVDNASTLVRESWDQDTSTHASGGSYAQSASAGDKLTFSYSGTAVRLFGARMANGGLADVYVDGARKGQANFYAASTAWKQLVFSATVPAGHHVVTVLVTGTHRSGSKGNNVYVDYLGTGSTTIQEHGSGVAQRWGSHRSTDASSGTYDAEASFVPGGDTGAKPSVSLRISGSSFSVYSCKSPSSGYLGVWVDGHYVGKADLYKSFSSCNARVFTMSVAHGAHTVALEPLGTHRSGASGTRVSVDRITVG